MSNSLGETLSNWLKIFFPPSPTVPIKSTPKNPESSPILILVINSLNQELIQSLQNNLIIESDDYEKLYRATKYLWLGSESYLSEKLRNLKAFKVEEESEYDVYLIKIQLKKHDDGFKPNADQVERIYAFRRLAGLQIEISDRLKVEVYENTNVYSY